MGGYTSINIILDRSGSMQTIEDAMEEGLQGFLTEQKKLPGRATVSLYRFDSPESIPDVVFSEMPVGEAPKIKIEPRGSTALNQAMCIYIDMIGAKFREMKPESRPDKVLVVVITDGGENASKLKFPDGEIQGIAMPIDFTVGHVKHRVHHQTDKYNWDFVYLGANQDAIQEASERGFLPGKALTYMANANGSFGMNQSLNRYTSSMRAASNDEVKTCGFSVDDVKMQEEAKIGN